MADGVIVTLRVENRVCSNCQYGYLGPSGVYCRFYSIDIWQEKEAQDCEEFTPQ